VRTEVRDEIVDVSGDALDVAEVCVANISGR
jgi:hypothetical protein